MWTMLYSHSGVTASALPSTLRSALYSLAACAVREKKGKRERGREREREGEREERGRGESATERQRDTETERRRDGETRDADSEGRERAGQPVTTVVRPRGAEGPHRGILCLDGLA